MLYRFSPIDTQLRIVLKIVCITALTHYKQLAAMPTLQLNLIPNATLLINSRNLIQR